MQSINFLIFVDDPYFNEPAYGTSKGSSSGNAYSKKYNMSIRKYTMAHAVLDHITNPDPEFGDAILHMLRASWPVTKAVFERWAAEEESSHCTSTSLRMIHDIESRLGV